MGKYGADDGQDLFKHLGFLLPFLNKTADISSKIWFFEEISAEFLN